MGVDYHEPCPWIEGVFVTNYTPSGDIGWPSWEWLFEWREFREKRGIFKD